mmetsp:Transcript_26424/g.26674  ORF Transcript_26424/g.26674 Transcript_26424/m.26674 type:complete len:112 (+) Transcript_26424:94-429(+)
MAFSRKQLWRRQRCSKFHDTPEDLNIFERRHSYPSFETEPVRIVRTSRSEDVLSEKKSVRFASVTRAVLIPSRTDFYEHDLIEVLWWSNDDYSSFKQCARDDLQKDRVEIA